MRFAFGLGILGLATCLFTFCSIPTRAAERINVAEDKEQIVVRTPHLEATIKLTGYVSGVARLKDLKTDAVDLGFGLHIADWLMEPGSDAAYRDKLDKELVYEFNNAYHGKTAKKSIEGPQICTKAKKLEHKIIRGKDFVAVQLFYTYNIAAPGKNTGSKWVQTLVFPDDTRYFFSSEEVTCANESDSLFIRIDMPGHIKHERGDTFSEVYLSYHNQNAGIIPASEFSENFAPDEKFNYRRDEARKTPDRVIRAYHIRGDEKANSPWLGGLTLAPDAVYEAWCHERGYICMIEEVGGNPVKIGETLGAAYIVGFFDSVAEMRSVYDKYRGALRIDVDSDGFQLK
jgi:hypothetical protein